MKQFLLVYRRSTGQLLELEDLGADMGAALQKRFAVEREQQADPDVEVVLLSATSREALARTHARYFRDTHTLATDLSSALSTK
jgi:hypothetical protein